MPDKPMKDDEQGKPMQGTGQDQPVTQPDKSNERPDKDRKASDQEYMKKHSPSPNNPNDPQNPN
jgi:hypothetical protein